MLLVDRVSMDITLSTAFKTVMTGLMEVLPEVRALSQESMAELDVMLHSLRISLRHVEILLFLVGVPFLVRRRHYHEYL